MATVLGKRPADSLEASPDGVCSTLGKIPKINDPFFDLTALYSDSFIPDFGVDSLFSFPQPSVIDLTGSDDVPEKPETLIELINELKLSVQGEFCQLENLLLDGNDNMLFKLTLPRSKFDFIVASKGEKSMMIPIWIDIGGFRYHKNEDCSVHFGGYGAVAFYNSVCGDFKPNNLPDTIAVKIGKAPEEDLEDLVDTNYDLTETKSHWMREFMIQMRLKRCFMDCQELPFVDLFAASIAEIEPNCFQAFSVLEAGVCDLFHLFTSCPFNDSKRRTDLKHLVKIMQSTAYSLSKLHSVGLHHGDVKLANVLVDLKTGNRAIFMDFDGSVFNDEDTTCDTYTMEYVSPQRSEDDENYNRSADDCWALGISFLIALTLKKSPIENMPLNVIKSFDMRFHLKLFMLEIKLPQKSKKLIEKVVCGLLTPEEDKRMTAAEAAALLQTLLL